MHAIIVLIMQLIHANSNAAEPLSWLRCYIIDRAARASSRTIAYAKLVVRLDAGEFATRLNRITSKDTR